MLMLTSAIGRRPDAGRRLPHPPLLTRTCQIKSCTDCCEPKTFEVPATGPRYPLAISLRVLSLIRNVQSDTAAAAMYQVSIFVDNGCSSASSPIRADAAESGWLPDGTRSTVRRKPGAEQPLRRKRLARNRLTDGHGRQRGDGSTPPSAPPFCCLKPQAAACEHMIIGERDPSFRWRVDVSTASAITGLHCRELPRYQPLGFGAARLPKCDLFQQSIHHIFLGSDWKNSDQHSIPLTTGVLAANLYFGPEGHYRSLK